MELLPGGSIKSIIEKFGKLDETIIRHYLKQLINGLKYLHDSNIIHRDLKCANVLLDIDGTIKITDFGTSKQLCHNIYTNNDYNNFSLKGSPYWMAPEIVKNNGYNYKCDIWSLGCTVYEMAMGYPPWHDQTNDKLQIFKLLSDDTAFPTLPD